MREGIAWAARVGFRAVQLDAAAAGGRPRELDRSARRDLAALLRRRELVLSGLDLMIPPEHFVSPAHADRAASALLAALELASELAALNNQDPTTVHVATVFPRQGADALRRLCADRSDVLGSAVADFAWPVWVADSDAASSDRGRIGVGVGIDVAAVMGAGESPAKAIARHGPAVLGVRVSELIPSAKPNAARHTGGRLDAVALVAALGVVGYRGCVVLSTGGAAEPEPAAREALGSWPGSMLV
ncbi:MAG: hypothetical protein JNM07_08680 [Phycisphaerae bacterium]|nr:hypothetical protein [Phycisphaerae bacterium]